MSKNFYLILIGIIDTTGAICVGIGGRAWLGYAINTVSWYKYDEEDIGMAFGSSIALTLIGLSLVASGIIFNKHEKKLF